MSTRVDGRRRAVVESVRPCISCGRFPVKRTLGDALEVTADVFGDGHDELGAVVRYRHESDRRWTEASMAPLGNDRWRASVPLPKLGRYRYAVRAWVDPFRTWRGQLERRIAAGQDVSVELLVGAGIVASSAASAGRAAAAQLSERAERLQAAARDGDQAAGDALDRALLDLMAEHGARQHATESAELEVWVEPELARCSAWYELFPRSLGGPGRHGTLKDVTGQLGRIAAMGFDVLYLPPIHPIGEQKRKGRNNAESSKRGDPGSPWAIGSKLGGHTAVHPELGTVDDVRDLVEACRGHGIELALDLAFQCAPDHPWVKEHPDWFRHRPDGSIRHAENPPKLYQDIVPLDFESEDWPGLWDALLEVVRFWIGQGVHVFRVDNPHTKPFAFWDWLIGEVKRDSPEVIFLSEAFTRPRVMERLAKGGFTQSYTYFAWRSAKWELTEYLIELTQTELAEYMRPNFWPNTPDILTEQLQTGGRPVFAARLLLAATLGASYGIYGPAFELMEGRNLRPGSEEYLDSEKYQLREWKPGPEGTLEPLITAVNAARSDHPALRRNDGLRFHHVDNDMLIAYSKHDPASRDTVVMVVNLDPNHMQAGWVGLDLGALDIDPAQPFQAHDVLDGSTYLWSGSHNYVELRPDQSPGHILHLRRHLRTERDFEYFG
ncbi:MAG: alpha-1,4-glucan--maltose-1-phosphate maltosyltransferase [Gaiellales bacterium]